MTDRGSHAAKSGVQVDIKRLPGGKDPEDSSRIAELFERLGGSGKIKVFRLLESGDQAYSCTLEVDDTMSDELEERIAARVGGGAFYLKGFHKGKFLSGATILVDAVAHPNKLTELEQQRQGLKPQQQQQQGPGEFAAMMMQQMAQQQQSAEHMRLEMAKSQQQMMVAMMQLQENAAARQVDLTRALVGAHGPSASSAQSGISQITDIAALLKTFGWAPSGGAAQEDQRPFVEQVLLGPLQAFANKVGEKVGDAVVKGAASPVAPTPAPSPQLPPPPKPADVLARPPAGAPVRLPAGARMISQEEQQRLRAQQQQGAAARPRPASGPAKDTTPRSAPSVKTAVPEAVKR